jgi:hypothetical protein
MLYEINTRCWLHGLSARTGRTITLADVPETEFAEWRRLGFTHIWLMGVWTSGPRARAEALASSQQRRAYSEALPDWREEDVSGSPYAVAEHRVPSALGGESGLSQFRRQLHSHGLKLMLDFVPNHLGLDHPWLSERPELFVQSPTQAPGTFRQQTRDGPRWLAHGKDPYFPAWSDTVQLDYRRSDTRAAMTELLLSIAQRCDGVRCDMAMLLLNEVFARTWTQFPVSNFAAAAATTASQPPPPVSAPAEEFWGSAIQTVKQAHPGFFFLAEIYWGLEPRLQALGFDCTYDKVLYDRLVARDVPGVPAHLFGLPPQSVAASAHFLENHDEPRIASLLSLAEHRAAALLILGLPGMRFLHEGQLDGARVRIPVQLLRRFREPVQSEVRALYEQLLTALPKTAVGCGNGQLLRPKPAWAGNATAECFVVVQWQLQPPEFDLVVVNLAPHRSQCYAPLSVAGLSTHNWSLNDVLGPEKYQRFGDDLQSQGLYLDLPAHGAQLFHFSPIK